MRRAASGGLRRRRHSSQVWPSEHAAKAEAAKEGMCKSSKMILPGTLRRRVLAATNGFLLAVTVAQWAVVLGSPCRSLERTFDDCPVQKRSIDIMDTVKGWTVIGCGACLLLPFFVRWLRGWKLTTRAVNFLLGPDLFDVKPGEWTLATSRSIFAETLRVCRVAQSLAVAAGVVVTIAGGGVHVGVAIKNFAAEKSTGGTDYASVVLCGEADRDVCRFLYHIEGFRWLDSGTLFIVVLMTLVTPLQLWSVAGLKALTSSGQQRLRQLRHLPAQVLAGYVWHVALIATEMAFLRTGSQGRWAVYFHALGCLLLAAFNIGIVIGTLTLPEWATDGHKLPAGLANSMELTGTCDSFVMRSSSQVLSLAGAPGAVEAWTDVEGQHHRRIACGCTTDHGFRFEAGLRFQLDILLLCALAIWTWREVLTVTSLAGHLAIWAIRLGFIAVMLLLCKDPGATFDCLQATDAGFGLLVDAGQLRKALHDTLHLERAPPTELKMYRGSFLRMQETLAVSYKWQNAALEIGSNISINMSRWQLEELRRAIANSNARYVWIDKLSVPQETHAEIKTKLLTRMMAVYATAGWTVALRSCEPEGDRYHQRGWTLQEFCAAPRLRAVTEMDEYLEPVGATRPIIKALMAMSAGGYRMTSFRSLEPSSTMTTAQSSTNDLSADQAQVSIAEQGDEEPIFAVESSEEEASIRQRLWCQDRAASCVPFWLSDGVSHYDIAALKGMHKKYRVLSAITNTTYQPDHVRALYPLVANCPVEHQEQLLQLVDQICEPLGVQDRKVQALKNQTRGQVVQEAVNRSTARLDPAAATKAIGAAAGARRVPPSYSMPQITDGMRPLPPLSVTASQITSGIHSSLREVGPQSLAAPNHQGGASRLGRIPPRPSATAPHLGATN